MEASRRKARGRRCDASGSGRCSGGEVAMKTVVQISALVLIGYLVWAYGIPWVERAVGRSGPPVSNPAEGQGGACVQAAARASEKLHDDMMERGSALEEA